MFDQLNRSRPVAGGGFLPLPWSEIDSYTRLHRIRLKGWELSAITALDDVWLDVMGRQHITEEDLFLKEKGDDA